jgi:hypothetical protein
MFTLNFPQKGKKWKPLPKIFKEKHREILHKFFLLEKMFPLTERQRDPKILLQTVSRAEFDIVPIKASQTVLTAASLKEESDK